MSGEAGGGLYYPDSAEDEDEDFADEWDSEDSNRYQDRVEAGLEQEDSSDGN